MGFVLRFKTSIEVTMLGIITNSMVHVRDKKMNRYIKTSLLILFFAVVGMNASVVNAQDAKHRVVFQLTSDNPKTWNSMLNNVENAIKDLGDDTQVEVVAHSGGLAFLVKETNKATERAEALSANGVRFLACENTMSRKNIKKDQLVPFAETIPSGVGHIVKRQSEGWSYIRMTD